MQLCALRSPGPELGLPNLFPEPCVHRFVLPEDTPVLPEKRSWLPDNSRGVQSPIAVVSVRKVEDNKWIIFAAGATSGLVADAVTHPIDTIRCGVCGCCCCCIRCERARRSCRSRAMSVRVQ